MSNEREELCQMMRGKIVDVKFKVNNNELAKGPGDYNSTIRP